MRERASPDREEVEVWVVPLRAPAGLWEVLGEEDRARAQRLIRPRDRDRFVAAHAALRLVLSRCLDAPPEQLAFGLDDRGRPHLPAGDVGFSLSRSDGLSLIALARARVVGIDIERRAPTGQEQAIAERFFDPHDAASLSRLSGAEHAKAFFRLWCARESVAKAAGTGITAPPPPGNWSATALEIDADYAAAVAVAGPPLPTRIVRASWIAVEGGHPQLTAE